MPSRYGHIPLVIIKSTIVHDDQILNALTLRLVDRDGVSIVSITLLFTLALSFTPTHTFFAATLTSLLTSTLLVGRVVSIQSMGIEFRHLSRITYRVTLKRTIQYHGLVNFIDIETRSIVPT